MTEDTVARASTLVRKGLQANLSPRSDREYEDLIARYQSDPEFARAVKDICSGLELHILEDDVTTQIGLPLVPSTRDSRFAVRMSDLRMHIPQERKGPFAMAHIAICACFYPTAHTLEDDNYHPLPMKVSQFRDSLRHMADQIKKSTASSDETTERALWQQIAEMRIALHDSKRSSLSSIVGLVSVAAQKMTEAGLIRKHADSEQEEKTTYTAKRRLRAQLRAHGIRHIYEELQKLSRA